MLSATLLALAATHAAEPPCPEVYASAVVAYVPGPGVEPEYAQARNALGPPDFVEGRNAVSLGNSTGPGSASLTVRFARPIVDGPGVDLYVYERGPSAEPTVLEVSTDGASWVTVGRIAGSVRGVDLSDGPAAEGVWRFLRLTGVRNGAAAPWAGPDIDAIGLRSCEAGRPNS
jgi:hypothetical protein